jgi:hypothetical protein
MDRQKSVEVDVMWFATHQNEDHTARPILGGIGLVPRASYNSHLAARRCAKHNETHREPKEPGNRLRTSFGVFGIWE